MNLTIKQNNQVTEQVTSGVIDKLYNLTKEDVANGITAIATVLSGGLQGRIEAPAAYQDAVDYLNTHFGPNLIVSALAYYIRFADQEVIRVLLANNIGDGTGVTVQDAASANLGTIFKNNTTIESFNELQYFSKPLVEQAFSGCSSLKSVTLPESQTILNRSIFASTALPSINIPVGYTTIRQNCFSRCSMLTQVSIPSTLISLENYAFGNCDALDRVDITDLDAWCGITFGNASANPLNYAKHLYLNNTLVTTVDLTNITELKQYVFINLESLTSITNFSGLTAIGGSAFEGCINLVILNLNLPSLASLGNSAFRGTKVQTISDLGSITSIPSSCFNDCKQLSSVSLSNLITSIGNSAFQGCTNLSIIVNLPNLVSLGQSAFYNTAITQVQDLGSIDEIPGSAFQNCSSITNFVMPNSVTSIGWRGLENCGATGATITLSTGLKSVGRFGFTNSKFTTLVFPEGFTTLDMQSCNEMRSLISVELPTTITSIGDGAFSSCGALTKFVCKSTTPNSISFGSNVFFNSPNVIIYVPDENVNDYKTATGWSAYASIIKGRSEIPT